MQILPGIHIYKKINILYIVLIWSNIQQLGFVSTIIPRNQEYSY